MTIGHVLRELEAAAVVDLVRLSAFALPFGQDVDEERAAMVRFGIE